MASQTMHEKIDNAFKVSGNGVMAVARVIGRNDHTNQGRVRIYPLSETNDFKYIEHNHVEYYPWAHVLSPAKGENHGIYYTPEFGDFVVYTSLASGNYILGSVVAPTWEHAAVNIPTESQNTQANGKEYHNSHWPCLNNKGYHLTKPVLGDVYQPSTFLQRWRRNDILMYNTTKIGTQAHSAAKLMEIRSAENNMLQFVDIGNFNTKPGIDGKSSKEYSPARQTDYRDLWEGFNINREFWTERTDKPPLTNESQYVKLASNGNMAGKGQDKPWGDTGADLPDLTRGEIRWDDRVSDGSHETTKTYCPIYQTLKVAQGPDRYHEDKKKLDPYEASVPYRFKVKKWIEDTGNPYDPEVQHFNVGHYLTLSNTIFKRRLMLSSARGHQLVFSDIDKDEKILMNSHRGKHLYMEDSDPGHYDSMWLASQKHHMLFVDHMQPPYLIDDKGAERHRLVDPNQLAMSSFQLIQTEKYQKIWLADSPKTPRIHMHSTDGHEVLLLDHDYGTTSISPTPHKGKIQITTSDKQMQITMDVENGDITIQNHNLGGKSGKTNMTGDISIYAAHDIKLHAKNMIQMRADKGYDIQSSDGSYDVVACGISHSTPCGSPHVPEVIRETVLTDIDVTEGKLINKYNPS